MTNTPQVVPLRTQTFSPRHICCWCETRVFNKPAQDGFPSKTHRCASSVTHWQCLLLLTRGQDLQEPCKSHFSPFPSSLTVIRSVLKRRWVALIEYVLPPNPPAAPCCVSVLWTGHRSRCTRCYVFINTSSSCSPEKLCVHFISAWTDGRLRLPPWLPQTKVAVFRMQAAGTMKLPWSSYFTALLTLIVVVFKDAMKSKWN